MTHPSGMMRRAGPIPHRLAMGRAPCPDARFAIRVRTAMGPAIREYVAPGCGCIARAGDVVVRFRVADMCDLVALYDRLLANEVDVVGIRRVD